MSYLLILGGLFGVLSMALFLYLYKEIVLNSKTARVSFALFVLTIIVFEIGSIYVMRTTNKGIMLTAFKIVWSSLIIAQVLRIIFLSIYTKVFYKCFILLFVFLSFITLTLNLCIPSGLMREGISSQELNINYHAGQQAFALANFSKYALLELVLIVLLNVYTVVVLINYYRKTHSRNVIWILISFFFIFVVQLKLVVPFDFYFYMVHVGYLGLTCTLVIIVTNESVKYVEIYNKLKLKKIIDETREEAIHMIIHDLKVPLSVLKNVSACQSKEDIIDTVQNFANKMQYQIVNILDVYKHNSSTFMLMYIGVYPPVYFKIGHSLLSPVPEQ
jgi:hypothetical protein